MLYRKALQVFSAIVVLFLCIKSINGEIEITVNISSSKQSSSVKYSGSNERLSTEKDVSLFNATEDTIKRGIRIELGKAPDGIFFRDPTSYGDLYKKFHWKQVNRRTKVKRVKIYDIVYQNVTLKSKRHINKSNLTIKAKIKLFETVEVNLVSSCLDEGYPGLIFYDLYINSNAKRLHLQKNSNENFNFTTFNFGVQKPGFIPIEPGQVLTMLMYAKKTTVILQIDYVTSLTGCIIANYRNLYGKYHYYAPQIYHIMRALKMRNEIITSETVEINLYTAPELRIFDSTDDKNA